MPFKPLCKHQTKGAVGRLLSKHQKYWEQARELSKRMLARIEQEGIATLGIPVKTLKQASTENAQNQARALALSFQDYQKLTDQTWFQLSKWVYT